MLENASCAIEATNMYIITPVDYENHKYMETMRYIEMQKNGRRLEL